MTDFARRMVRLEALAKEAEEQRAIDYLMLTHDVTEVEARVALEHALCFDARMQRLGVTDPAECMRLLAEDLGVSINELRAKADELDRRLA